ncbi:MAG: hypothetical protein IJN29_01835 [Akkermansia sp.]|nr:hypothetical protein [Akkermansia sp.]
MPQPELLSVVEIEAALWQEVEEAREAERAEKLNEPVTDVEPTAEAPAQELSIADAKPETTEEVEDKFINLRSKNRKKWIDRPRCMML